MDPKIRRERERNVSCRKEAVSSRIDSTFLTSLSLTQLSFHLPSFFCHWNLDWQSLSLLVIHKPGKEQFDPILLNQHNKHSPLSHPYSIPSQFSLAISPSEWHILWCQVCYPLSFWMEWNRFELIQKTCMKVSLKLCQDFKRERDF